MHAVLSQQGGSTRRGRNRQRQRLTEGGELKNFVEGRRKKNCGEKNGSHGSFTQEPEHNYPLFLLSSLFPPFLPSFSLASTQLPSASYHGNRRGAEKRRETRSVPTRR